MPQRPRKLRALSFVNKIKTEICCEKCPSGQNSTAGISVSELRTRFCVSWWCALNHRKKQWVANNQAKSRSFQQQSWYDFLVDAKRRKKNLAWTFVKSLMLQSQTHRCTVEMFVDNFKSQTGFSSREQSSCGFRKEWKNSGPFLSFQTGVESSAKGRKNALQTNHAPCVCKTWNKQWKPDITCELCI